MERMQHFARFFQFILNVYSSSISHVPSTEDAECLGRPTSTRAKHVDKMKEMYLTNRKMSTYFC